MKKPLPFAPSCSRRASLISFATAIAAACALANPAFAQTGEWPTKPIKLVVPYTPGGSTDTVSRVVFEKVAQSLGQPIVIDNKPGANSTLGSAQVVRAPADGYTFLSVLASYAVNMSLYKKLPYKPTDLVPVSQMAELPMFLFTSKHLPVKNVAELLAYGKTHPLNYASSGTGASAHLMGARLAMEQKLDAQHVPYNGSAPILADLMSGQVSMVFDPLLVPMPHVKTGKINVLAVASAKRWPGEPNVPTMVESGYPDFVMSSWAGVMAPAGTPAAIVARMSKEIAAAVQSPEVKNKLEALGFGAVGGTPAEFQALITRDAAIYKKIIDAAKVTVD